MLMVVIFFYELCIPWHSMHHSLPPVRKCNNVIPVLWTSRFLATEQPWPQYISLQNLGQRVYQTKAQGVTDLRRHLVDVRVGVEQTMAQTSPCRHSSHKRTFWILLGSLRLSVCSNQQCRSVSFLVFLLFSTLWYRLTPARRRSCSVQSIYFHRPLDLLRLDTWQTSWGRMQTKLATLSLVSEMLQWADNSVVVTAGPVASLQWVEISRASQDCKMSLRSLTLCYAPR